MIDSMFDVIITELFRIFDNGAVGNYAHFKIVLTDFLRNYPVRFQIAIAKNNYKLLDTMIPFISVTFVYQVLVDIFASNEGIRLMEFTEARERMMEWASSSGLVRTLILKSPIHMYHLFMEKIAFEHTGDLLFSMALNESIVPDLFKASIHVSVRMLVLFLKRSREALIKFEAVTEKGIDSPNHLTDVAISWAIAITKSLDVGWAEFSKSQEVTLNQICRWMELVALCVELNKSEEILNILPLSFWSQIKIYFFSKKYPSPHSEIARSCTDTSSKSSSSSSNSTIMKPSRNCGAFSRG